jgi:glutamate-1-semialdehyde 2,1-aminomutase
LATAAGLSVLRRLRDPSVYDELERRAALLAAGLVPFGLVQRVGGMLTFFPGSDPLTVVTKFEQLDVGRYAEVFRGLLERGIYLAPSQYECLFPSLAHGDEEIEATVEAVGELLAR